jgi:hypothetical protein
MFHTITITNPVIEYHFELDMFQGMSEDFASI